MGSNTTFSRGTVLVLVGTKRGLFLLNSRDRERWEVTATGLAGRRIFYATLDQRTGHRMFAADNGDFFGAFLRYSDDFGQTWQEPEQGIQFPEASEQKLENIWIIEPGRSSEPGTLYAGVDPASLWISSDSGVHWSMNDGLANHPTRSRWEPGAGGLCLHSIIVDPTNAARMWVGISAVGCMRTDDGGQNWGFANKNVRADFLPEKYPEFGQCIHRMVQHPTQPDVLYQQNHCGIYKSINAGDDWIDIQHNLPSEFGFPIALDAHHPDTVFVVVENPAGRHNVSEQFTVYRTQDGGERWQPLTEGLPSGAGVSLGVLRHGMCADTLDPCGVYVGTNTGQVFASHDRGDSWSLIADFLPPVYSVNAIVIE
ncbi:MAG TPA: sialidase family protein [Ktedonobacteraceae bacterium]|nr:sialidase family protein [Ktedonobacteraceae bacterium]